MLVSTLAGSVRGYVDGELSMAKFGYPTGIVFNPRDGCLYITDQFYNVIRKVENGGMPS